MEDQKVKRVNVTLNHGNAFFSDSITIADNEDRFVLDFKQTSPRFDQIGPDGSEQQTSIIIKHKTIVLPPALAKVFHEMLGERIEQHEKMFGKIKKKAKKESKITDVKEAERATTVKPSYFG